MSYVLQYSKCKSKQDEDKSCVGQQLKIKYTWVWQVMCRIIAEEAALLFLMACRPPLLSHILPPESPPLGGSWDKAAGDRQRTEVELRGPFLKGSSQWEQEATMITVSTDSGWLGERAHPPFPHLPLEFFAGLWCGAASLGWRKEK